MFSLFSDPTRRRRHGASAASEEERRAQFQDITKRSPTKRALIVGLNYVRSPLQISGCIEDAHKVADVLKSRLHVTDRQVICDAPTESKVTRSIFLGALDDFLIGVDCGDVIFFHFSGSSSQGRLFLNEEESVSLEEVQSSLLDPLPIGVTLFIILDCGLTEGFGLRFRFEGTSSGPKGYENIEVSETSTSVVVLSHPDMSCRGSISRSFVDYIERVYLYSITLESMLNNARDSVISKNSRKAPRLESGQLIDLAVPFGRLVAAPI
jgi:hypothetical protein